MTSKKLLSLLLAFCLILGCVTPATAAGVRSVGNAPQKDAAVAEVIPNNSSLMVQQDKADNGLNTLRDQTPAAEQETASEPGEGAWVVTPADKAPELDLNAAELPASVKELQEAAQIYAEDEIVSAMVVLEDAPLIKAYADISLVPGSSTAKLEKQQDIVIQAIENDVLEGEALTIDSRFTYVTNALAIEVPFGKLHEIAMVQGVKSVFLMPVYQACATDATVPVAAPMTAPSGAMAGVPNVWADLGYTGTGMTIAVFDTGLDLDHPSFAADPALNEDSWTLEHVQKHLESLNAYDLYAGLTAEDLYRSAKVPFAFNYGSNNLDATHDHDNVGDHGTHVSGIAAANPLEETDVVGMAPDAQVVVMKVFNDGGGANMNDILEAMEDAMVLGCDVVNMSLGSPAGFSDSANEFIDSVYAAIGTTEMVVNVSAGNEGTSSYGNLWGTNMNPTTAPDNGSIASPSTYVNVNSIASVDNNMMYGNALFVDGNAYMYKDGVDLGINMADVFANNEELEYVMIGGYGEPADYEGIDVAGKVAVAPRGVTAFSAKLAAAEAAGAIALIVTNNEPGSIATFGMSFVDTMTGELADGVTGTVPCVMVTMATGEIMAAAENKVLSVSPKQIPVGEEGGGQMSDFSCWGVSPDLRLLPDIAGVGGNVYSCYDKGEWGYMSGTSMSCPQVSGLTALVLQYLKELDMADSDISDALLMSTAVPVVSVKSGVEASPRQQGSGLANAQNAITAGAYLIVDGGRPKVELFDFTELTQTFTFTVHNFSDAEKTYALSGSVLTEDVDPTYAEMGLYFMAGYDRALEGTVTFDADTVTVAAGSTAEVTATVTLTENDVAWFEEHYPVGGYVEGYVYLDSAEGVDLSLPYMGFFGDWTEPEAFDSAYWYENTFFNFPSADGFVDGNEYFHVFWTSLAGMDWVLGLNPYVNPQLGEDGKVVYDPANNVVSPNGDGALDGFEDIYLSLMRNAKELWFTYTNTETGEVYFNDYCVNVSKTMFQSSYQQVVPFIYSWYGLPFGFTDADGNTLPNNTKIDLAITAKLDYADGGDHTIHIPVTVDTQAPELLYATSVKIDGRNHLVLSVDENVNLAYVAVTNPSGSQTIATASEFTANTDGTFSVAIDITDGGNELMVALCDYGANEAFFNVTYTGGNNIRELPKDGLYGYRVYDENIYDDSLYGWVSIDKETAEVTQLTNDMYEYYALTAAEYVDGTIFAVDAGYNFLVIEPGTFNRKEIRNLGISVWDMAWDDVNNQMYISGKYTAEDGGTYYALRTLDLLTGEMTDVIDTYSSSSVPFAMTFVDGTLYAVKQSDYYGYLYSVNFETGKLVNVLDATGAKVVLKRANGTKASPYYNQSMTYSETDGCIYWSFFNSSKAAELIKITPATETTDITCEAVVYPVAAEIVGIMTLDEDADFSIPEADGISILKINYDNATLMPGQSFALSVECLPWNYEITTPITWTSSDETVATVVDGVVTAVAEGTAVITAECEGVTTTCTVAVLEPKGQVYGYNYYSANGWGDWFSIDVPTLTYTSLTESGADFICADYNGHDGKIYGYDENKNFYRFDPASGETVKLGKGSVIPYDMAYDYSTGLMYAIDSATYTLYNVNMNSGELLKVGGIVSYDMVQTYFITLACSTEGQLYAIDAYGDLYEIYPEETMINWDGTSYVMCQKTMSGLPACSLVQSMCYDHNNGTLVWPCADYGTLIYIDLEKQAWVSVGDPTGTGTSFELIGMYSIPEVVPELPYVAVESVTANDLAILTGGTKLATATVLPLNATNQAITWTSSDESVATVTDGYVTGVKEGTATVTGTLVDNETTYTVDITVTVLDGADNLRAYLISDLATYGGYCWMTIDPSDPVNGNTMINENPYTMYSAEYVDGTGVVYGYGYDDSDWEANKQFMLFDAKSYKLLKTTDMGEGFPFVYDMAYDYTTGTMYALASYNDASSDLYMVDLQTGSLILVQAMDFVAQSLVADKDGNIYAISDGSMDQDWFTGEVIFNNSQLYKFNLAAGTAEPVADLGTLSTMFASAAYDFDTNRIYWARFAQVGQGIYDTALSVIDLDTMGCYDLGTINAAGAQVTGMHFVCDSYPETPDELRNITMNSAVETMVPGDVAELNVILQPATFQGEVVWTSSNEAVATVDQSGTITAVAGGTATITATVMDGEKAFTATCKIVVYGEENYLISYNQTDNGFTAINFLDPTQTTNLTEGGENADLRTMELVDGIIYGYGVDGKLYTFDTENGYAMTELGEHGVELLYAEGYTMGFDVRDMAWDAANERMLVLGCHNMVDSYGYWYEVSGGCRLYEADLTTGKLTELTTFKYPDGGAYSNVYTITVAPDGTVYYYSSYIDYIGTVDTTTGIVSEATTLQSLSFYGGSDNETMSMACDAMSGNLYLLLTTNGKFYQMVSYNPKTGGAVILDKVGEVIRENYAYVGDVFGGLTVHGQHVHTLVETVVEATCETEGSVTVTCAECGEVISTEIIPATGHTWVETTTPATCEEEGSIVVSCSECGKTLSAVALPATGHNMDGNTCLGCGMITGWSGYTTWQLTMDGVLTFVPTEQTHNGETNLKNYWKVNGVLTLPWGEYADIITKVVISDGIHDLGQMAFYELPNLTTVELGADVVEVRSYAFKNCSSLTTVIGAENIDVIGEGAFYGCSALTELNLSENVQIGDWAFSNSGFNPYN